MGCEIRQRQHQSRVVSKSRPQRAYGVKAIQRILLQMKYVDRMYSTLLHTWSTLTLRSRGNRPYFLSACACPSPLAPPDPAPPDSPALGGAIPLTPPAPAPFDPRDTGAVLCISPRSNLWKRWILGRRSSTLWFFEFLLRLMATRNFFALFLT